MANAANLTIPELALCCAEEHAKYGRQLPSDPQFCFELMRRALADGASEALTQLFGIYEAQVTRWVHQHSGFEQTGESAEYFSRAALNAFYFALSGERFGKIPGLAHALAYLKVCVHTCIAQYLREQRRRPVVPLERADSVEQHTDYEGSVAAGEVWQLVCALLPDPADRTLARCAFLLEMKPRQIVRLYPQLWESERAVSLGLFRIRRLLRRSAELRQRLLGDSAGEQQEAGA